MSRNRFLFGAFIALAVVVGVVLVRSGDGGDKKQVETAKVKNCPPVARADAAATKPGTPISIDILANDTDPDGESLSFQILTTQGGESSVDDGGTPTDASDDRVLFRPADPPPAEATIDYQALDPTGALSESTVTIVINVDGVLPSGLRSEVVPAESAAGDCAASTDATETTIDESTETSTTETTEVTDGSVSVTTTKPSGKGKHTTTTRRSSATTATTRPPNTTAPHTTTTVNTTTTAKPTTTTTGDPCGPRPDPQDTDAYSDWQKCRAEHS